MVEMSRTLKVALEGFADSFEALAKADPLARCVIDHLRQEAATKGCIEDQLTSDRIEEICRCTREQAVGVTQAFAENELGDFVVGRRGASTRICWNPYLPIWASVVLNPAELAAVVIAKSSKPSQKDDASNADIKATVSAFKGNLAGMLRISPDAIDVHIRL
ncbi:hypothetical protein [Roseomonas sp. KE0001]|uniref:hypothetical protein n=1 Tax=Roseomonas sp. KE0001 TaxID=2479201 RepID=UPI0018E00153|nr:hypothetical protein [Roseomonas sp. KE0001]